MKILFSIFIFLLSLVSLCVGYKNPVIPQDLPDPGVLYFGKEWFMASTGCDSDGCYPVRVSSDLLKWSKASCIITDSNRLSWMKGDNWAPELHMVRPTSSKPERLMAIFTVRHTDGVLVIAGAFADTPRGPWKPISNPLVKESLSVIDATIVREESSGRDVLVWKVESNPTVLKASYLKEDLTGVVDSGKEILRNDRNWEGVLVEGPWIVYRSSYYYLFYSVNMYNDPHYAIGVARSKSVFGPYTKAAGPVLEAFADGAPAKPLIGPGHCSVVRVPETGADVIVYHAWTAGHVGQGPGRYVLVDKVSWGKDGWPRVAASGSPTCRDVPAPTSEKFAKMAADVRVPAGNGTVLNFKTFQWNDHCWSTEGTIDGSCAKSSMFLRADVGLLGYPTVSFSVVGQENVYARHRDGLIWFERNDGSDLFKSDASWLVGSGLATPEGVSLHPMNFPNNYIRHYDGRLRIDPWDGSVQMAQDATWNVAFKN